MLIAKRTSEKLLLYTQVANFAPLTPQQRGCTKARSLPYVAGETPAYPTLNLGGENNLKSPKFGGFRGHSSINLYFLDNL